MRGLRRPRGAEAMLILQVPSQKLEFLGCSTAQHQQGLGVASPPVSHGRFGQSESGPWQ